MLFNSWPYAVFLALTLVLYWQTPTRTLREYLLLIAGYVFYMAWFPPYAILLALLTLFGYTIGLAMAHYPLYRRALLLVGVGMPLAVLIHYKYWGFLVQQPLRVAGWSGSTLSFASEHVILPLGISFFTFELICYLVDISRLAQSPVREFHRFALFMAFFPRLIAGPITRPHEFFPQLDQPKSLDWGLITRGMHLFVTGLFLKVGVADTVGPYVSQVFGHPGGVGFAEAWVGAYAFAIQIFCDFAGYTAMAQGSALMFGFRLPANFDAPYFAPNITEFWRRWHMSLSRWLRDYLYIPLGGSRGTAYRTAANLFFTMTLAGLWHGAQWTFAVWGMLVGLCLILHKLWRRIEPFAVPDAVGAILTFHIVCLGWVFFRASSLSDASQLITVMVDPAKGGFRLGQEGGRVLILVMLFLAGHLLVRQLARWTWPSPVLLWSRAAVSALVLVLIAASSAPQQFIYFQF